MGVQTQLHRPECMPVTLAERVGWALDESLRVDLDDHFGDDDDRMVSELAALQCQKARFAALEARLVERWDARKAWAADGSRSASSALARDGGLSAGVRQGVGRQGSQASDDAGHGPGVRRRGDLH